MFGLAGFQHAVHGAKGKKGGTKSLDTYVNKSTASPQFWALNQDYFGLTICKIDWLHSLSSLQIQYDIASTSMLCHVSELNLIFIHQMALPQSKQAAILMLNVLLPALNGEKVAPSGGQRGKCKLKSQCCRIQNWKHSITNRLVDVTINMVEMWHFLMGHLIASVMFG